MSDPALYVYWLRQVASEMLPMEGSNIPVDICLAIACHHRLGNTLTMKRLVYELPYSEAGIQYNLRELQRNDWVDVHQCANDRRVRRLHPSKKLEQALFEYWDTVAKTVDQARQDPESLVPRLEGQSKPEPFIKSPATFLGDS